MNIISFLKQHFMNFIYYAFLGLYIWRFFNMDTPYLGYVNNILFLLTWWAWINTAILIIGYIVAIKGLQTARDGIGLGAALLGINMGNSSIITALDKACDIINKTNKINKYIFLVFGTSLQIFVFVLAVITAHYRLAIPIICNIALNRGILKTIGEYKKEFVDIKEVEEEQIKKPVKPRKKKKDNGYKLDRLNSIES